MRNGLIQTLKEAVWYSIANSIIEEFRLITLNDVIFLWRVKNGNDAIIHLPKKHIPLVVKKTINELLYSQSYVVTSMKYCYHGMDITVSKK